MEATGTEDGIDRGRVQELLAGVRLPPQILRVDTDYGQDHTGDPAVFLTFHLSAEVSASKDQIRPISRFAHQVVATLLQGHIGGFAYARLKEAA